MVRTPGFHPGNRSSILLGDTTRGVYKRNRTRVGKGQRPLHLVERLGKHEVFPKRADACEILLGDTNRVKSK